MLKIGVEMVGGSLAGGAATWAVVYASYGIQGGSAQPGAAKAALYSVLGALLLCLGTACRFRWPQHLALAGVMFNLSLAVGLAVLYSATSGCELGVWACNGCPGADSSVSVAVLWLCSSGSSVRKRLAGKLPSPRLHPCHLQAAPLCALLVVVYWPGLPLHDRCGHARAAAARGCADSWGCGFSH